MVNQISREWRKLDLLILVNTLLVLTFAVSFFTFPVTAVVGDPNASVTTILEIGNTFPEILNITIDEFASDFDLTANTTTLLTCVARLRDFNGDGDIDNVNATFFRTTVGEADPDDNNNHYTNGSCYINTSFVSWQGHADDQYTALANCTYLVEYYADPGEWNCSMTVNDTVDFRDNDQDNITINTLLALALPDTIDFGLVNATAVSDENQTNISNAGNVEINLSLEGYAYNNATAGAGFAMNCSIDNRTIDIIYEKFNLSASTPGQLTLTQFENTYTNLSSTPSVRSYNLNSRQSDVTNDAINSTYWRIYVPEGAAGNCTGTIVFGATQAVGV
jgi:hypothetical protein